MRSVLRNSAATVALSVLPFASARSVEAKNLEPQTPVAAHFEPQLKGSSLELEAHSLPSTTLSNTQTDDKNEALLWTGIVGCPATSAALSGLTLGVFSVSRLRLSLLAAQGDESAKKVLGLRQDSNTTLSTLVWGNVGINVVMTLLSDKALTGAAGIAFSVGALTVLGEIIPQAYFSRHALRCGAALEPLVKGLRCLLYPVAKPCGMLLDRMVGQDAVEYFGENDLKDLLRMHTQGEAGDISHVEATGSANFLSLDDVIVREEGESLDASSIIEAPLRDAQLDIPDFTAQADDALLRRIRESGKKWVVFCQPDGTPRKVLDANAFLRDVLFEREKPQPRDYWHKPIVVSDPQETLGNLLTHLHVEAEHTEDDVIDNDVILLWTDKEKRIITGSDILGRIFRGIAKQSSKSA